MQERIWHGLDNNPIGKIQKVRRWVSHHSTTAILHLYGDLYTMHLYTVTCQHLFVLLTRHRRKSFSGLIMAVKEIRVHYQNPNRKRAWADIGQPTISTPKFNIDGIKVLLHVWWYIQYLVFLLENTWLHFAAPTNFGWNNLSLPTLLSSADPSNLAAQSFHTEVQAWPRIYSMKTMSFKEYTLHYQW